MKLLTSLGLALAIAATVTAARADDYDFRPVDFPGAANTALYAINDGGTFVGALKDAAGRHHAIVGTPYSLALPGSASPLGSAVESWAYSINRGGDVAGAFVDAANATHGHVLRASGAFEIIDRPGAAATEAYGINAGGSVIGISTASDGTQHAYLLRAGRFSGADVPGAIATYPLSINGVEEIVGEAVKAPDTIGYGYLEGRRGRIGLATAPGSAPEETYFVSINDRQQVLGGYADAAGESHAFLRDRGGFRPFELPPDFGATFVSAQTINNHGDIVGYYADAAGVAHGFVAIALTDRPAVTGAPAP